MKPSPNAANATRVPGSGEPAIDGLTPRLRMQAILAVMIAVCLATLDTAIANVALPTIAADIGADPASSIWVINAYQLAVIASVLPMASIGESVGHRYVFIAGLILFTATSLLCGLAWSLPSIAVARALQGLGAGAIMSVNLALIRFVYPSHLLGRGVGLNALVVGVAFTVGPTIASFILSVAGWPWLFYVNVPTGLVAIVVAIRALPATRRSGHRFDPVASALCGAFFALLIVGISGASQGLPATAAGSALALAVLSGVALWMRQRQHPAPMLAVDLFRRPLFALSAMTAICSFAAQGLAFVSLPFLLQTTLGHSQVETGFLITPWPAVVALLAPFAGRLSDRYPPAILGGVGLLVLALGMASLGFMPPAPSAWDLGWRLAVCGAGFGFFQSPNLRALMTSAPPERSGGASGIIATARLLGQTGGAALVALCFRQWHEAGPEVAIWMGCAFALIGSLASFSRLLPARAVARQPA